MGQDVTPQDKNVARTGSQNRELRTRFWAPRQIPRRLRLLCVFHFDEAAVERFLLIYDGWFNLDPFNGDLRCTNNRSPQP